MRRLPYTQSRSPFVNRRGSGNVSFWAGTMEDTTPRGNSLRFATFELDVRSRELRSGSNRVRLQDQPFEILRLMLERPGDVITREELQHRLWPKGTYVD